MVASIDTSYVIAPSLQMYFVDKDSGLPLTNGKVWFFKDTARGVQKDVYQIVSAAPGGPFTYNPLPNPCELSSVGSFVDANGVDTIPYYYPYDDNGNAELYWIEVYDHNNVLQFTREAWPNITNQNVEADQDITNFIPNGQFLAHVDIPATSANSNTAGRISSDVTVLGQGGWTFERTPASTAVDIVTFPLTTSAAVVSKPTGFPKYVIQIQTVTSGSDTYKDLRIKFNGVNTFASDTQSYNLYFEGCGVNGSITGCQLIVRKFFGTGGSPSATTETEIDSGFTLASNDNKKFNFNIIFGTNTSKTIGTNNDDYVQICLRVPPNTIQKAQFANIALVLNDAALTLFPAQTEAEQMDVTLAGWTPVPNPSGSDLYLPIILKPTGFAYDQSAVGQIIGKTRPVADPLYNELLMDGTIYKYSEYSTLGIPYSRLGDYLIANSPVANTPMYGTGTTFATVYVVAGFPNEFYLNINQNGLAAPVTATALPTGFSFIGGPQTYTFTAVVPPFSSYFTFTTNLGTPKVYNVWYEIDGVGTAPAVPTGDNIKVALVTGDAAADVVTKTLKAVNKYQYAILDARGYFWRGLDLGTTVDPSSAARTITALGIAGSPLTGANVGSFESQALLAHSHTASWSGQTINGAAGGTPYFSTSPGAPVVTAVTVNNSVGAETRPVNLALNWFIKY